MLVCVKSYECIRHSSVLGFFTHLNITAVLIWSTQTIRRPLVAPYH